MLKHEKGKLSYFGLGFMSIFQLGESVKMYTRPSGEDQMYLLDIETKPIFDIANEDKPISFLKNHIHVRSTDEFSRAASPAPSLDKHLRDLFDSVPSSFTEIVIENVNESDMNKICNEEFVKDMKQLLPLRTEKNEPFLKRFKSKRTASILKNILNDTKYCPTIDVYFGISELRKIGQMWKYFPEFKRELAFGEADVEAGYDDNGKFAYYLVHTTEDLERQDKEGAETGFWVRNRNFLVKSADFFEQAGSRKKYVHEPLKNWMFGEIFHQDMNPFLSVARDEYLWDKSEFHEFRDSVTGRVEHLNKELRRFWREKSKVYGSLVEPFIKLCDPSGPLRRTEKVLRMMRSVDQTDTEFPKEMLAKLDSKRSPAIENDKHRIDKLLQSVTNPITLADDEDMVVEIDPQTQELEGETVWDSKTNKLKISLSPKLFEPQDVIFLGKTFEVVFVVEKEEAPGISVNAHQERIYINPFNHDLKLYNISFLDVYIAIELADTLSKTKEELKYYLLRLLGRGTVSVEKFLTPLEDDLMRRRRSR